MDSSGTLGEILYAGTRRAAESEKDWVRLVRSTAIGNQLALHALYERAQRPVFTLIMRITSNRETAEELTLDVFHDVWRRASSYDPANGSVLGWIMNQARSRAIDRLRFENRHKRTQPDGESVELAAAAAPDAHDVVALRQQSAALRSALSLLTVDERKAIEAAFFSGLTHVEVATQLGEPLGTVKTRIRSGLHKLRAAIRNGAPKV